MVSGLARNTDQGINTLQILEHTTNIVRQDPQKYQPHRCSRRGRLCVRNAQTLISVLPAPRGIGFLLRCCYYCAHLQVLKLLVAHRNPIREGVQ